MIKVLRVGDPHVKINNLAESAKLIEFVYQQAILHSVDRIEILGDLFHNHAVLRVEILSFWQRHLQYLAGFCEVVALVGNHDQTGDYEGNLHALNLYKLINSKFPIHIIDYPTRMGVFAYLPYIHHEEPFLEAANKLAEEGAKTLVCHATFQGSQYDNGFYAPDGFDLEKLNYPLVISGHIHKRQRFGKAIYPGTGKWDTNSDANEEKGLWLVTHDETGAIISEQFIDTAGVCTPIYSIEWNEGQEQPAIPAGRVTLELIGSSEWIKKQKERLKGQCGLKSKITDKARSEKRQVTKGLADFVTSNFEPVAGVSRESILEYMKEHGLV